jgi:uncharacterized protein
MLRETPTGVVVDVRVIPRARKTAFSGIRNDELIVRVAAPPVDGSANDALIDFLADALHVSRRAVQIVGGEHARHKRVTIVGVKAEQIRARCPK